MNLYFGLNKVLTIATLIACSATTCFATDALQPMLTAISGNAAIKTLGWDPAYTLYGDSQGVENGNEYTIYCYGIGQSQESIRILQKRALLVGKVIGFDFEDAVYNTAFQISKTSFGQEHETQALLYLLKHLDEAGIEKFHLYGYSRGGAVIMNAIKQLICYKKHVKLFKRLALSQKQADRILEKFKVGTIVLDCPLVDLRAITRYRFPLICGFLDCVVLPVATNGKYVPWRDQSINSAKYCKYLDLAFLVHFQERDTIVTNVCDDSFYKALEGPRTMRVSGNDGGHFHRGDDLVPALVEFHKKYGGPYKSLVV